MSSYASFVSSSHSPSRGRRSFKLEPFPIPCSQQIHCRENPATGRIPRLLRRSQARICGPHRTNSPDPWDVQGTDLQPPNLLSRKRGSACGVSSSVMFPEKRILSSLISWQTRNVYKHCLPLAGSSGITGAFPGSHHSCPFARCSHSKPPLVGKGDQAHPATAKPIPDRTRCPRLSPPAGWEPPGPWDVLMLPWAGKGKGLEVSPVLATPGDRARGAVLSREEWESSTFPRGHGWTHGCSSCWMSNDEHKQAEQTSTHLLSPSCRYQTRSFLRLLLHSTTLLYSSSSFSCVAGRAKLFLLMPNEKP